MDDDVRFSKDVYSVLLSLDLTHFYFALKEAGFSVIRDVLYLRPRDLEDAGIDDPRAVKRIGQELDRLALPDTTHASMTAPAPLMSGRLIARIYSFLDYKTVTEHTVVCKSFRTGIHRGLFQLFIRQPTEAKAPLEKLLKYYERLRVLRGTLLGERGGVNLASAVMRVTKLNRTPSTLRVIALTGGRIGDSGLEELMKALRRNCVPLLEHLSLERNNVSSIGIKPVGVLLASRNCRNLISLSVSHNPIGDRGSGFIMSGLEAGEKKDLAVLELAGVGLGDTGVQCFEETLGRGCCPSLSNIDFRWNTKLTSRSLLRLQRIVSLRRCPLTVVRIRGHSAKNKGVTDRLLATMASFGISGSV